MHQFFASCLLLVLFSLCLCHFLLHSLTVSHTISVFPLCVHVCWLQSFRCVSIACHDILGFSAELFQTWSMKLDWLIFFLKHAFFQLYVKFYILVECDCLKLHITIKSANIVRHVTTVVILTEVSVKFKELGISSHSLNYISFSALLYTCKKKKRKKKDIYSPFSLKLLKCIT